MSVANFAARLLLNFRMMYPKFGLASGLMAALVIVSSTATAATYSAGGDLKAAILAGSATNPSGPWQYGESSTAAGGAFTTALDVLDTSTGSALEGWYNPGIVTPGGTVVNPAGPITFANTGSTPVAGPGPIAPGDAFLHPGPSPTNGYAEFLFTAPSTGPYLINATFYPANTGTDDVHVTVNGVTDFTAFFAGDAPAATNYTHLFDLAAGSTIAFTEGAYESTMTTWSYNSNALGLDATITLLPEPSSIVALCGLGAMGLILVVRRRRQQS